MQDRNDYRHGYREPQIGYSGPPKSTSENWSDVLRQMKKYGGNKEAKQKFNPQGKPNFNPQNKPNFNPQNKPNFNPQGKHNHSVPGNISRIYSELEYAQRKNSENPGSPLWGKVLQAKEQQVIADSNRTIKNVENDLREDFIKKHGRLNTVIAEAVNKTPSLTEEEKFNPNKETLVSYLGSDRGKKFVGANVKSWGDTINNAKKAGVNVLGQLSGYDRNNLTYYKKNKDAIDNFISGKSVSDNKSKENYKGLAGLVNKFDNTVDKINNDSLDEKKYNKMLAKEGTARALTIKNKMSQVGSTVSLGLDAVSSKHKAQSLAEEGYMGQVRKSAKFAQMLGDNSFLTRLQAGTLGRGGWAKGSAFARPISGIVNFFNPVSRIISNNRKAYSRGSRAFGLGLSEIRPEELCEKVKGIMKSFNETETNKVENIPWQIEEQIKLGSILDIDYNSIAQKEMEKSNKKSKGNSGDQSENVVNEEQQNISEQVSVQPIPNGDLEPELDLSALTPEVVSKILNSSYYTVPEEEKKYLESLAKGFSEKTPEESTYDKFLKNCCDVFDLGEY